jgi:hypothetical protein
MVQQIIADEPGYPATAFLSVAERDHCPIAGAHTSADMVGNLVASVTACPAPSLGDLCGYALGRLPGTGDRRSALRRWLLLICPVSSGRALGNEHEFAARAIRGLSHIQHPVAMGGQA